MNTRLGFFALTALFALPLLAAAANVASKPAKPLHIAKGEPVKLTDYVVPGKTTVFDFYSDFCGPCVQMSPSLEKLHRERADVVVVKVDINRPGQRGIDWKSPVAQQYKLQSIPHFKVYGPDGKLLAEDAPGNAKARQLVTGMMK
jgi:thiol-disulfide isomerase/thioredoxin